MKDKNTAQHRRTRDNKIKRIEKMLKQNPEQPKVQERLEFWKKQA